MEESTTSIWRLKQIPNLVMKVAGQQVLLRGRNQPFQTMSSCRRCILSGCFVWSAYALTKGGCMKAVLLVCALLVSSGHAMAQESRGTIQGRLLDASGGVVPDAVVTATNVATNTSIKAVSNSEGAYNLLYLLPGTYALSASARAGLKPCDARVSNWR